MPFTIITDPPPPDTIAITTSPSAAFSSYPFNTPAGKTLRYVDVYTTGDPVEVIYEAGTANESGRVLNGFDRINPATDCWGPVGPHDLTTATLNVVSGGSSAEVVLRYWFL